jgi:hypothetical protein
MQDPLPRTARNIPLPPEQKRTVVWQRHVDGTVERTAQRRPHHWAPMNRQGHWGWPWVQDVSMSDGSKVRVFFAAEKGPCFGAGETVNLDDEVL